MSSPWTVEEQQRAVDMIEAKGIKDGPMEVVMAQLRRPPTEAEVRAAQRIAEERSGPAATHPAAGEG